MATKIDHLYFVLGKEQFEEFKQNNELSNFFEYKYTKREDMEYEGFYIYFDNNQYFEILLENEQSCLMPGLVGVALSDLAENSGSIKKLNQSGEYEVKERSKDGEFWFKRFSPGFNQSKTIFAWFMEYSPFHLKQRTEFYKKEKCYELNRITIGSSIATFEFENYLRKIDSAYRLNIEEKFSYQKEMTSFCELKFFRNNKLQSVNIRS